MSVMVKKCLLAFARIDRLKTSKYSTSSVGLWLLEKNDQPYKEYPLYVIRVGSNLQIDPKWHRTQGLGSTQTSAEELAKLKNLDGPDVFSLCENEFLRLFENTPKIKKAEDFDLPPLRIHKPTTPNNCIFNF